MIFDMVIITANNSRLSVRVMVNHTGPPRTAVITPGNHLGPLLKFFTYTLSSGANSLDLALYCQKLQFQVVHELQISHEVFEWLFLMLNLIQEPLPTIWSMVQHGRYALVRIQYTTSLFTFDIFHIHSLHFIATNTDIFVTDLLECALHGGPMS